MLRYITELQSRELSLAHSMIPLGSCTMKLNATSEMLPVTLAGVCAYAPVFASRAVGRLCGVVRSTRALCWQKSLVFTAVSFDAQRGESGRVFAGLLTIKAYHNHHGQSQRNICLIPESAHGTNPASAIVAGLKVVAIKVNDAGGIVIDDLRAKAEKHKG